MMKEFLIASLVQACEKIAHFNRRLAQFGDSTDSERGFQPGTIADWKSARALTIQHYNELADWLSADYGIKARRL